MAVLTAFQRDGSKRWVSVMPDARSRLTHPNACERDGRQWLSSATVISVATAAMAAMAGAAVCSRTIMQYHQAKLLPKLKDHKTTTDR